MRTHFPLYVIVFVSGAVVLAIEIVGTRVLGPFYGVSLFLWSALITVTLAGLAIGYAIGGRWADRAPRYSRLAAILATAGVWLFLSIWLKRPVIQAVEPLGLRGAVLAASMILFFPPLTLLGMVSPFAIRLRAESLGDIGRTAGNLYAVSTIASVVGAVGTGFFLIPYMGVNRLIAMCAAALFAIAIIALRLDRGRAPAAALSLILPVGFGALGAAAPIERVGYQSSLLAHEQSPYADIRVLDWEDNRLLLIDGGTHTIVERERFDTVFSYAMVLDVPAHLFEAPGRMLLIGLGGGSVARDYYRRGWDVESVEIDRVVADIAQLYFSTDPESASIHIMDGRQYLLTNDDTHDLVIMDAFGSSSIPFHLVTTEAFGLVKSRMTPDGVLAINIETREWHDILTRSLAATLRTQFAHVLALPIAEPPNTLGNIILLASDRTLELDEDVLGDPREALPFPYLHTRVVERRHAWANRFEPDTNGAPILTDDRNPVDIWAEAINWTARRHMHSEQAWDRFAW